MELEQLVEHVGEAVEVSGVAVVLVGLIVSMAVFAARWIAGARDRTNYLQTRQSVGRSILLGLELLVAGDIIRTVALTPTFTSVGVLAAVVAIRTFLSFTLEVEITGRWPWQQDT